MKSGALPGAMLMVLLTATWTPVKAGVPMSYLHTFGPAGDPATQLGWGLGIVSLIVIVVIGALLLGGVLRRRIRPASRAQLTVKSDSGGMFWIYIGVGISTVVLIGCAVWTMITVAAVAMPGKKPALTLQVTSSQWWWSVRYLDKDPARVFVTANEIHIPVGQPVRVELSSDDVIHSFWVPQLAGKTDAIPGQTNVTWIQADQPGLYRGQCGEYCGVQHAHMALWVHADSAIDFKAWRAGQLRDAVAPASTAVRAGQQAFMARCAACHTVRGTPAGGILGPDLTHLMSRQTIGAGLLRNTPGNLSAWIANAQALKPGSRMPSLTLSGPELASIVTYLNTLK